MLRLHHRLAWHLRTHHGIVTAPELEVLAVPLKDVRRLARAGVLERFVRGAWRLSATPRTFEHRVAAACASHPTAIAAFTTAARIWKLRGAETEQIHVLVYGDAHPRPPGAVVHQCYRIDECDVVVRADGTRVTSPARTVFDLAAVLTDRQLEAVIEQFIDRELCTYAELVDVGRRLRRRGRTGSARFGRVLASRPAQVAPAGSRLELRLEHALLDAGLPRPERQHVFVLPNGQRIRADFYWHDRKVVVEVDHSTWHAGRLAATQDKRRDRLLLARFAVTTVRVTEDDIRHRLPLVVDEVARVLARSA